MIGTLVAVAWFYPEKYLCVDSGPARAEVIVVLGGGFHERAERAAELYRRQAAPRIIVSGAGDDVVNRQILVRNGVPGSVIEMEGQSKTTYENAAFTARRLQEEKVRSVILVTSWYHARRALKTFEHCAPDVKFYVRPSYVGFDRGEWRQHGYGRRMHMEFLKLPAYWFWYGVKPF